MRAVDSDAVWCAIDEQRRRTADLLESLSEQQWRVPSLCPGWTVRDVAAHLTLQEQGVRDVLRLVVRHPGDLRGVNHLIRVSARRKAARPVEVLVAQIRATVGSRRHNVGVTPLDTLTDVLVHSQDIALPLGRDLPLSLRAAATAADRVWSCLGTRKARVFGDLSVRGLELTATDTPWSAGVGPQVRGPITALLLLLTGRPAALPLLGGAGVERLRLSPP